MKTDIVTISNDDNTPPVRGIVVNLAIPITIYGSHEALTDEALAKHLLYRLNHYNDGRYPFSTELIHTGLYDALNIAINSCVDSHYREIHGNDTIQIAPGHQRAIAYQKALDATKDISISINNSVVSCSIEDDKRDNKD